MIVEINILHSGLQSITLVWYRGGYISGTNLAVCGNKSWIKSKLLSTSLRYVIC